ncbi:MAG: GNAT family N-acetyltransferase [Pseudomonadota bacterium]
MGEKDVEIHRAGLADLDDIAVLFNAYRVFYRQTDDLDLARAFIGERMERQDSVIFIARGDEGRALGFTQLYPSFSSVSAQAIWILNDLYIDDRVRSQGLGTQLLERARQWAIETGAKGVSLETERSNVGAQALYERLGYAQDSDHYFYFLATPP